MTLSVCAAIRNQFDFYLSLKNLNKKVCWGSGHQIFREKEMTYSMTTAIAYHRFVQSPLSPILLLPMRLLPRKKRRGKIGCFLLDVQRLLSNRTSNAKTTTIATIMPVDTGMKYKSAADAGDSVGGAVAAGADSTLMPVSADEPQ